MTLQSIGVPTVNIHSPTDIVRLFEMTRLFNVNREMSVIQRTVEDDEFSDTTIRVKYLPLVRSSSRIKPENYKKRMKLSSEDRNIVLSFICTLHPKPGALNIVKCIELGVPRGPSLGDLKRGMDVTLPDGRIVKSSDVTDPPQPGNVFLVIDCPSEEYVDSLLGNRELLRHTIPEALKEEIPVCIVHFTPPEVMENERYMKWIATMPSSIRHFVLNKDNPLLAFSAAAEFQEKIRSLDPDIFPSLHIASHDEESSGDLHTPSQVVKCSTLTSFDVRTPDAPDPTTGTFKFDRENGKSLALSVEGFPEAVKEYREKVSRMKFNKSNVYPIVTFFGTASAIPGKDRNTSCIHISISECNSMIMDCGEQSYGQMLRFFGTEKIEDELLKIKCIFVSHIHADHHLGLIRILKARHEVTHEPVLLIGPQAIQDWLKDYSDTYEDVSYLYHFRDSNSLYNHSSELNSMDLIDVRTFRVVHCKDSFGITITTRGNINNIEEDPFKIVYSGDAMQSPQLVTAGQNCDLLIHEATMEDDLAEDAKIKRHCTTSQAIEMGIRCKARNIILTHFSQRYAKIPMISEELLKACRNVSTAFDNMRIHRYDYDKLPLLHPPLRVLFNDYVERNDQRLKKKETREKLLEELEASRRNSQVKERSSSN